MSFKAFLIEEKNLIGLDIGMKFAQYGSEYIDQVKVTDQTPKSTWNGDFFCNRRQLTSLKGAPSEVHGDFDCANNQLTSLEGSPSRVKGQFACDANYITSLEGAPGEVNGHFSCNYNKLTSLKNIHKVIHTMRGNFSANNNPIKSHVLGILLINGLAEIRLDNRNVESILNKYLPNTIGNKAVLACQNELLDDGFDEFAQI
jgi:hypothetical protein